MSEPCPRCGSLNDDYPRCAGCRFVSLTNIAVDHEKRLDDLTARVKSAESRLSVVAALEQAREAAKEQIEYYPGQEAAGADSAIHDALSAGLVDGLMAEADRAFGVEGEAKAARSVSGMRPVPTGPWPPQAGDLVHSVTQHGSPLDPGGCLFENGPALRVDETQGGYVRLEGEREWRANGSVRVVARKEER